MQKQDISKGLKKKKSQKSLKQNDSEKLIRPQGIRKIDFGLKTTKA